MPPDCTLVFLPCHSLDDFPTWLDEAEADDLLSAWIAAWHPALIASVGGPPRRASVDLPPPAGPILGIVPATWDDRFAAQFDAARPVGSSFVRRKSGVGEITSAAAAAVGGGTHDSAPLPGEAHAADFHALGLAALLAELLARRMRSHAELESTGFPSAVATAARAAVDGRDADCRAALRECFDCLAATRHRYYPVDSWLVDLVLVAESARPEDLAAALDSPVPLGVVATGATIESLARRRPEAVRLLREAAASGRVGLCGGRDADRPLDACTPEEILASFLRGRDAWQDHVGAVPDAFARIAGGGSAILPQVLGGLGCTAGVWSPFDGSSMPDVGGGLIRWFAGGASVDMVASPPLDARPSSSPTTRERAAGGTACSAGSAGGPTSWAPS
jgi:alpha-mannosidase